MHDGQPTKDDSEYASNPQLLDNPEMVFPHQDKWAVQAEGAKQPAKVFERKSDAIEYAKHVAQNKESKLYIYDQHHNKQTVRSYTSS